MCCVKGIMSCGGSDLQGKLCNAGQQPEGSDSSAGFIDMGSYPAPHEATGDDSCAKLAMTDLFAERTGPTSFLLRMSPLQGITAACAACIRKPHNRGCGLELGSAAATALSAAATTELGHRARPLRRNRPPSSASEYFARRHRTDGTKAAAATELGFWSHFHKTFQNTRRRRTDGTEAAAAASTTSLWGKRKGKAAATTELGFWSHFGKIFNSKAAATTSLRTPAPWARPRSSGFRRRRRL